jgi:hypothetical protein
MKTFDEDRIDRFMRALAASEPSERRLPDPRLIARRARLLDRLSRQEAEERATRPVLLAGLAGPLTAAAITSVLAASRTPGPAVVAVFGLLAVAAVLPLALCDE